MPLRFGSSYWLEHDHISRVRAFPRHHGQLDLDVAIVGGGFTGCLIAYVFAIAGVRVAVFERGRIGHGSAGASTALLMQAPDRYLTQLTSRYGRRRARTVWRLSKRAAANLIRTLQPLRCGLHRVTSLHVATSADAARDLRREVRARRKAGIGGRLLDRDALLKRVGLHGAAAIQMTGDAVVDPYRATVALARAAERAGALVFEHSEVSSVRGNRRGAVVTTRRGKAMCRFAVIATGFATPAFKPLQARFRMATTYVIGSSPIPRRERSSLGTRGIIFWDTGRPYHYFRWTDDARILFGGEDRPVPSNRRARRAALVETATVLRNRLLDFFPDATPPDIANAWDGLFATTPDGLPYIGPHRRYPRQLFALGYGGNGMTFASLAAEILLRHVRGRPSKTDALFGFRRGP